MTIRVRILRSIFAAISVTTSLLCGAQSPDSYEQAAVKYADFELDTIAGYHESNIATGACDYKISKMLFSAMLAPLVVAESQKYNEYHVKAAVYLGSNDKYYVDKLGYVRYNEKYLYLDKEIFSEVLVATCPLTCRCQSVQKNNHSRPAALAKMPSDLKYFFLNELQLAQVSLLAEKGDLKAIERVVNFYGFIKNDNEKYNFWLRKGSQLNNAKMQYRLATRLSSIDPVSVEARRWFESAAISGNVHARWVLDAREDYRLKNVEKK